MADNQVLRPVNIGSFLQDQGLTLVGVDPESTRPIFQAPDGTAAPLKNLGAVYDDMRKQTGMPYSNEELTPVFNTPSTALNTSDLSLHDRRQLQGLFSDTDSTTNFLKKNYEDFQINQDEGKIVGKKNGVWRELDPSVWGEGNAWNFAKAIGKWGLGTGIKKDKYSIDPKTGGLSVTGQGPGGQTEGEQSWQSLKNIGSEFWKGASGLAKSITTKPLSETATELVAGAPQTLKNTSEAVLAGTVAPLVAWGTRSPVTGIAAGGASAGALATAIHGLTTTFGRIDGTYNAPVATQVAESISDGLMSTLANGVALGVQPMARHFWDMTKAIGKTAAEDTKGIIANLWAGASKEDPEVTRQYLAKSFVPISEEVFDQAKSGNFNDVQRVTIPKKSGVIKEIQIQGPKQFRQNYEDGMIDLFTDPKANKLDISHEDVADNFAKVLGKLKLGGLTKDAKSGDYSFTPAGNYGQAIQEGTDYVQPAMMKQLSPYINQLVDHLNGAEFDGNISGPKAAKYIVNFQKGLNFITDQNLDPKSDLARQLNMWEAKISAGMRDQTGEIFNDVGLNGKYTKVTSDWSKGAASIRWADKSLAKNNNSEAVARDFLGTAKDDTTAHLETLASSLGDYGNELTDRLKSLHAVERSSQMISDKMKWNGFVPSTIAGGGTLLATHNPVTAALALAAGTQGVPKFQAIEARAAQKVGALLKSLDKETVSRVLADPQLFMGLMAPIISGPQMHEQMQNQILQQADQQSRPR